VAEVAGGKTGGGTLKGPFMTTALLDFSLNETERKRSEDLLGPEGFDVLEDNFLVLFGGFPVAFGDCWY